MNKLITKNMILLNLDVNTKEEVIINMAKVLEGEGRLNNFDEFINKLNEREEEFETVIGEGFAIPHGKNNAVRDTSVVFAKLKNEIKWSTEEKVRYVFMIAIAEKSNNEYLRIIAQLSRKIMREEFRENIKKATDIEETYKLLLTE